MIFVSNQRSKILVVADEILELNHLVSMLSVKPITIIALHITSWVLNYSCDTFILYRFMRLKWVRHRCNEEDLILKRMSTWRKQVWRKRPAFELPSLQKWEFAPGRSSPGKGWSWRHHQNYKDSSSAGNSPLGKTSLTPIKRHWNPPVSQKQSSTGNWCEVT